MSGSSPILHPYSKEEAGSQAGHKPPCALLEHQENVQFNVRAFTILLKESYLFSLCKTNFTVNQGTQTGLMAFVKEQANRQITLQTRFSGRWCPRGHRYRN